VPSEAKSRGPFAFKKLLNKARWNNQINLKEGGLMLFLIAIAPSVVIKGSTNGGLLAPKKNVPNAGLRC